MLLNVALSFFGVLWLYIFKCYNDIESTKSSAKSGGGKLCFSWLREAEVQWKQAAETTFEIAYKNALPLR